MSNSLKTQKTTKNTKWYNNKLQYNNILLRKFHIYVQILYTKINKTLFMYK